MPFESERNYFFRRAAESRLAARRALYGGAALIHKAMALAYEALADSVGKAGHAVEGSTAEARPAGVKKTTEEER